MEREGHTKSISGLNNMQERIVLVNVNNPITFNNNNNNINIPVTLPTQNVNPNQTRDVVPDPTPANNNNHAHQPQLHPRATVAREQDQYLPIANVIRIMRRILPPHAKISDEAKETVQECVSEYISFITGEANDRCRREQRKTVTAEDVLWAMAKLGFDNYVAPLSLYLTRYRDLDSDRHAGGTPEVSVTGKRRAAAYPPLVPVVPAYSCPSFSVPPEMFYNPCPLAGEFLMPPDGENGGGGSTSGGDFDPFGTLFK